MARVVSLINSGADVDYVDKVCHSPPTMVQYLYTHTTTGLISLEDNLWIFIYVYDVHTGERLCIDEGYQVG